MVTASDEWSRKPLTASTDSPASRRSFAALWHGAAWTFVAWGAFHGLMLVLERVSKPAIDAASPGGIAALTTPNGRFTIMMPHPERTARTVQMSWHPAGLGEDSPWLRMFRNARRWVG